MTKTQERIPMNFFSRLLVLIILAFILNACVATMGKKFDTQYARTITEGKTTKQEIRDNLGEPNAITYSGEGEMWQYSYTKTANVFAVYGSMLGGPPVKSQNEFLSVTFEEDIVKTFSLNKSQ